MRCDKDLCVTAALTIAEVKPPNKTPPTMIAMLHQYANSAKCSASIPLEIRANNISVKKKLELFAMAKFTRSTKFAFKGIVIL